MTAFRFAAAIIGLSACAFATAAEAQAPAPDLVYSRVKPCRVFDTTKTAKIPANSAKSFLISGAGAYAAQGGTAAGCGVPASAQAVTLNLTAINGSAAGSVGAMAYAQTTASVTLRYPVAAPETVGGVVDLLQNKITLRTTNTINAIGDVTGYYAPQMRAYVRPDGSLISSSRVVSVTRSEVGIYDIEFDRDVSTCSAVSSVDFGSKVAATYIFVPDSGENRTVKTYIFDSKTGASVNYYFNVIVIC